MKLLPCPFCQGPPAHFARHILTSAPAREPLPPSDDGHFIASFVFCHECGAESPHAEAIVCDAEELAELEQRGADLWNLRDGRHRELYDSNDALGNCEYPDVP